MHMIASVALAYLLCGCAAAAGAPSIVSDEQGNIHLECGADTATVMVTRGDVTIDVFELGTTALAQGAMLATQAAAIDALQTRLAALEAAHTQTQANAEAMAEVATKLEVLDSVSIELRDQFHIVAARQNTSMNPQEYMLTTDGADTDYVSPPPPLSEHLKWHA